jgi:hypothetical protein
VVAWDVEVLVGLGCGFLVFRQGADQNAAELLELVVSEDVGTRGRKGDVVLL